MTVEPFRIAVADDVLEDLRERLRRTRLPGDFANDDWSYGVGSAYLRELVDHWLTGYDWRARERAMNSFSHWRTVIDDVPIHFIHERGQGPAPVPLILSHGWPWTFWDYRDVIGPLADPAAYGGDPADAFDVVVPSLPGFGFSTPLTRTGIHAWSTADLWRRLMVDELGYDRFAAGGCDWGHIVTSQLGHKFPDDVLGIYLVNGGGLALFSGERPWDPFMEHIASLTGVDRSTYIDWTRRHASHCAVHVLDPQTLAAGLHDSPVGLAAWLVERRRAWSDCGGDVERRFTKEELLDCVTLYWVTQSFATSARFYAEGARHPWVPSHEGQLITVPTGYTVYLPDTPPLSRPTPRPYPVCYAKERAVGGHFAPAEEPAAFVEDVRATFRGLR